MPDRLAKDVMIPLSEYATVNANDSLKNALGVLKNSIPAGHRTLAVLDGGILVGFLTTRSILKGLAVYGSSEDIWDRISWGNFFKKIEREHLKTARVKDIMRSLIHVHVDVDTPLYEVNRVILKNQVNNVPVLDKKSNIVGIIRIVDILDTLADFLDK